MRNGSIDREWLSPREAGEYLGVSAATLYRMAKSGKVRAYKLGKLRRYKRGDLDAALTPLERQEGE
jgi:excisionase family DNA binding protein